MTLAELEPRCQPSLQQHTSHPGVAAMKSGMPLPSTGAARGNIATNTPGAENDAPPSRQNAHEDALAWCGSRTLPPPHHTTHHGEPNYAKYYANCGQQGDATARPLGWGRPGYWG